MAVPCGSPSRISEPPGDQVADQAERHALAAWVRSCPEQQHRLGQGLDPVGELQSEPGLAYAGLADHRDLDQAALVTGRAIGIGQRRQLDGAADQMCLDAFDAAAGEAKRAGLGPQHQEAAHRLVDALDCQRRLRGDIEHAANLSIRVLADAQRAGRCRLFHARGDVDREAADAGVAVDAAAEQHRPAVDADTNIESGQSEAPCHVVGQRGRFGQYRQAGVHRADGIVFPGLLGTEHCQQAVTRVLQDPAAPGGNDRRDPVECPVDDVVHVFRIERSAEPRRADDVHEEDRRRSQRLGRTRGGAQGL